LGENILFVQDKNEALPYTSHTDMGLVKILNPFASALRMHNAGRAMASRLGMSRKGKTNDKAG